MILCFPMLKILLFYEVAEIGFQHLSLTQWSIFHENFADGGVARIIIRIDQNQPQELSLLKTQRKWQNWSQIIMIILLTPACTPLYYLAIHVYYI